EHPAIEPGSRLPEMEARQRALARTLDQIVAAIVGACQATGESSQARQQRDHFLTRRIIPCVQELYPRHQCHPMLCTTLDVERHSCNRMWVFNVTSSLTTYAAED